MSKTSNIFGRLSYIFSKNPFKLKKPVVIQFPVTDICNSRCKMCRIWENPKSDDVSIEQLKACLTSNLFTEVTSIGFNGGEPTLRNDLPELVRVAIDTLPKLTSISLITNAYNYDGVISQIENVGKLSKSSGKCFDLMVSLDGYEKIHDLVRGKDGYFERAQHVITYAKESPLVDNLRIGCTVIRDNVFHLADLLDYCIDNDLYIKYRLGVPHQRLYTQDLVEPYALTLEERYELVEFLEGLIKNYETSHFQNHFYRSLIDQILYHAPRRAGCDWQHRGVTITAKGELAYCAVKSKPLMSDISVGDPEEVYFSNVDHLNEIISYECDACHHDYVGIPERKEYFKLILFALQKRLGVKDKISSLPGFSKARELRAKRAFLKKYQKYSALPMPSRSVVASTDGQNKKIMICGWYGTETLGDKAIIGGIITTLRSVCGINTSITVASLFPYVTEITRRQMSEFNNVRIVSLEEASKTVSGQDYLLFGGGPLMAIGELAPMQVLFERAKKASVITVASAVGVGPLGFSWLNNSIANLLNLCDFRIYRDKKSLEIASQLGVDVTNDIVAEDPAFTWLKGFIGSGVNASISGEGKVLLLGLRDFPYRQYAPDVEEKESLKIKDNYEKSVVDALEALIDLDPTWRIKPLPMCTNHFGDDDRWFYRRLFRGNKKLKPYLEYSLLGPELPPSEYIDSFMRADVLLGMRFHSVVFGLGLSTKTVAIDYTMGKGKVKSLSDEFEIEVLPMRELRSKDILSAILNASEGKTKQKESSCCELKFPGALEKALSNKVVH